jgi:hypothetical protein
MLGRLAIDAQLLSILVCTVPLYIAKNVSEILSIEHLHCYLIGPEPLLYGYSLEMVRCMHIRRIEMP